MKKKSTISPKTAAFGGTLLKNANARTPRPISTKDFMHILLKSEMAVVANGKDLRLLRKKAKIQEIITTRAADFGIKIHKTAIASDQVQLLVSVKTRKGFFNWMRRTTGLIARTMLEAEKGSPSNKSFWTYRPMTRIVLRGSDARNVTKQMQSI